MPKLMMKKEPITTGYKSIEDNNSKQAIRDLHNLLSGKQAEMQEEMGNRFAQTEQEPSNAPE